MRKHAGPALAIVLIVVLLYFGSYYALVRRGLWVGTLAGDTAFPSYPITQDTVLQRPIEFFFLPAHVLDRQLRRFYWEQHVPQMREVELGALGGV